MSKERKRQPPPLALEEVARTARDKILRQGAHLPTLIVAGSKQTVVGEVAEMPGTHDERVRRMRDVGFQLGQEGKVGRLEEVFFICEGWMSMAEDGQPPRVPPSQDPNRKEVLLVNHLALHKNKNAVVCFEMVRSQDSQLVALRTLPPSTEGGEDIESPLLAAFVAGFRLGARTRPN